MIEKLRQHLRDQFTTDISEDVEFKRISTYTPEDHLKRITELDPGWVQPGRWVSPFSYVYEEGESYTYIVPQSRQEVLHG